jgi:hypothetical protein
MPAEANPLIYQLVGMAIRQKMAEGIGIAEEFIVQNGSILRVACRKFRAEWRTRS